MIEVFVRDYLAEQLDVPVFMELPEVPSEDFPEMPERFVVLERVGTGMSDHIWSGSIAVQSYSLISLFDAMELNSIVIPVMMDIIERDEISEVRIASGYNHTDTRTKRYRYQTVFDLNY